MSEHKLNAWVAVGLIDEDAADRIRAWEAEHARPWALWAVVGIAALAIGLGLILVVAANWDDIAGQVRLAIHMVLMAALTLTMWLKGDDWKVRQPWAGEAALFVLAMLGMTFFGHIGQVYQTSSPLWQPLTFWLTLFTPLLLLRGQSWLAAALLMVVAIYTAWDYAAPFAGSLLDRDGEADGLRGVFLTAAPLFAAALGAWLRGRSARAAFWRRLEQVALAYGVGGASLITIFSVAEQFNEHVGPWFSTGGLILMSAVAMAAGALVAVGRKGTSGQATAGILAGAGLIPLLAVPLSGDPVMGALLFMALWAGIAGAALRARWRGVFQLAVAAVALRLIVLSFELDDDLLTSGAGLIFSGLLILGITWGALRIMRRYAPPKGVES